MNNNPLILIVDDETTILETLKEALVDEDYRVETLSQGQKTLDTIGKLIPDLVLLDIFMPNCDGVKLLKQIKKEYPQQKVMMISGFGNISIAIQAVKSGALDFIEKPLNLDEILSKISFLNQEDKQIEKQNSSYDLKQYGIIGESYLFQELLHQVNQVTNLNMPLLIYGEHGTGKTLFAKYIHHQSALKDKSFIKIDCSSLSEDKTSKLIESAFSEEGTILIKNIDQLSDNNQKKLLFFINENKKLRVIVSSRKSLFKLTKSEKFNESLFHKINITPLEIPPLNKRRYDIPLLVNHYLEKLNLKYDKSVILDNKSMRMLRNNNWQSNIFELKAFLEKIVLSQDSEKVVIKSKDLLEYFEEKDKQLIEEQSFTQFNSLQEATNKFEKNFLIHLLKKNRYDIEQVSDKLNLTPPQLRDKMLRLNIDIKS